MVSVFDERVTLFLREVPAMGDCSSNNGGLLTGMQSKRIVENDIDKTKAAWCVSGNIIQLLLCTRVLTKCWQR